MPPFRSRSQKLVRPWLLSVAVLMAASQAPPAIAAGMDPRGVVQHLYGQLLDTMKQAAALGVRGRYQKLQPLIFGSFDLPFMARLTIGPLWTSLTPEQKYRAVQAYGRYVTAVYANRFDGYSGQRLEVLGEQKIPHGMLVRSQIIKSNGTPVNLNYRVHDNVIGWQIRDVYETGAISELATQRSEYARILRTGGIEALIAALDKKTADLLKA